jgi:hypothetical protein
MQNKKLSAPALKTRVRESVVFSTTGYEMVKSMLLPLISSLSLQAQCPS